MANDNYVNVLLVELQGGKKVAAAVPVEKSVSVGDLVFLSSGDIGTVKEEKWFSVETELKILSAVTTVHSVNAAFEPRSDWKDDDDGCGIQS